MPPIVDAGKCIKCGKCAEICGLDVYGPTKKNAVPIPIYKEDCWHCNACVLDCPAQAITLKLPLQMSLLYREAVVAGGRNHD
jgi:adenylylsulfate reductase subunit B